MARPRRRTSRHTASRRAITPTTNSTPQKTEEKKLTPQELAFEQAVKDVRSQYDALNESADYYDAIAKAPETQYERRNYVREMLEEHKKNQLSEADKKRERNNRMVAAIGDGLSAVANFAGAVGGATPMQPKATLTEGQKKRFEEALKYREGYKTREERNAEMNAAVQQQKSEDSYYSRLRAQENANKSKAAGLATAKREEAAKAAEKVNKMYNEAKELGIKDATAKSIIKKNFDIGAAAKTNASANVLKGKAAQTSAGASVIRARNDGRRTGAYVANINDQIDNRNSPQQTQVTRINGDGEVSTSTTVKTRLPKEH